MLRIVELPLIPVVRAVTGSCDAPSSDLPTLLKRKASDTGFSDLVDSIKTDGQLSPVTLWVNRPILTHLYPEGWKVGNGNHRFAALIYLMAPTIKVVFSRNDHYPYESDETGREESTWYCWRSQRSVSECYAEAVVSNYEKIMKGI